MRKKLELPWLRFVTDPEPGGGESVSPDPIEVPGEDGEEPVDPQENEDKPLGPKGERALEAEKEKRRAAAAKLAAANARIAELEAPKEGDQTPEQLRAEIERETAAKYNTRIVRAEVKAAATYLFADPDDAVAFLNLSDFDVDDNGDVDASDIEDALTDLLARKPHLAKQGDTQRVTKKRVPEVPADPAHAQSKPESLDDRIAKAQAAGDFKTVIALQNQRLEVAS